MQEYETWGGRAVEAGLFGPNWNQKSNSRHVCRYQCLDIIRRPYSRFPTAFKISWREEMTLYSVNEHLYFKEPKGVTSYYGIFSEVVPARTHTASALHIRVNICDCLLHSLPCTLLCY